MKCKENASEHREKCTKNPNLCLTYKEIPPGRADECAKQYSPEHKLQGPYVSLLEEDVPGGATPRVGRPQGSVEPRRLPVISGRIDAYSTLILSIPGDGGN